MIRKHPSDGRCCGLALLVLATALTTALTWPLVLRADPTIPAGTSSPPPAAFKPETPDVAARREANRKQILDAHLDELRKGLQLTAKQEPLWPPIVASVHDVLEARGRRFRDRLATVDNSIDALKMQGEHMAKVGAAMARLADATRPLAESLAPDQKSRLPTLLGNVRPRKLMARAFGVPAESVASPNRSGTGAAVSSSQPSGFAESAAQRDKSAEPDAKANARSAEPDPAAGPRPQLQKDPDDDDD